MKFDWKSSIFRDSLSGTSRGTMIDIKVILKLREITLLKLYNGFCDYTMCCVSFLVKLQGENRIITVLIYFFVCGWVEEG